MCVSVCKVKPPVGLKLDNANYSIFKIADDSLNSQQTIKNSSHLHIHTLAVHSTLLLHCLMIG